MKKPHKRKKKPFIDTWFCAILLFIFYLSLFISLICLFHYLVYKFHWDRFDLICNSDGVLNYTIPFFATFLVHYLFIRIPISWCNKRYVRYCVLYGFQYDTMHWKIQEELLEYIGRLGHVSLKLRWPSSFSEKMNISDDEILKYWDNEKNVWTKEIRALFYIYNVLEKIQDNYKEIQPNNEHYYIRHELERIDERYNCKDFNCYDIEYPTCVGLRKNNKPSNYWKGVKMGRKHGFGYTAVKEGTIIKEDGYSNYAISYHYKINDKTK